MRKGLMYYKCLRVTNKHLHVSGQVGRLTIKIRENYTLRSNFKTMG